MGMNIIPRTLPPILEVNPEWPPDLSGWTACLCDKNGKNITSREPLLPYVRFGQDRVIYVNFVAGNRTTRTKTYEVAGLNIYYSNSRLAVRTWVDRPQRYILKPRDGIEITTAFVHENLNN